MRQSLFRIGQKSALALYRAVSTSPVFSSGPGRKILAYSYLAYKRWFEAGDAKALKEYVLPGTTVVDVGANIGFFTNQFAVWAGRDGLVIAIEPEIRNFEILRSRSGLEGARSQIDLIYGAAADVAGEAFLVVNQHHPGDHRLGESGSRIECFTIDTLVDDRPEQRVSLIKIDVQGHEYKVLLGSKNTIRKWRPAIFIEIDDHALLEAGSSPEEIEIFLSNFGYKPLYFSGNWQNIISLRSDFERRSARGYADYLFVI